MRRIAFRRLLPIIQVLLTTVLLYKGYLTYVEATAAWKGTWFENSTAQYHIYNPALEFCLAMNGPALLVGALAGMLAAGVLGSPELGAYFGVAIGTLMAAAFWYAYGLWVDRQLGTLPNNQVSLPRAPCLGPGVVCIGVSCDSVSLEFDVGLLTTLSSTV